MNVTVVLPSGFDGEIKEGPLKGPLFYRYSKRTGHGIGVRPGNPNRRRVRLTRSFQRTVPRREGPRLLSRGRSSGERGGTPVKGLGGSRSPGDVVRRGVFLGPADQGPSRRGTSSAGRPSTSPRRTP